MDFTYAGFEKFSAESWDWAGKASVRDLNYGSDKEIEGDVSVIILKHPLLFLYLDIINS